MKQFVEPKLDIDVFMVEDVITASGDLEAPTEGYNGLPIV